MKGVSMKKEKLTLLFAVIFASVSIVVALPSTVVGKTITVPDDYSTIKEAIDNASSGDTVFIKAGTYSFTTNGEAFPIRMKNGVSLVGEGADVCVLDAEGTNSVIYCFWITASTTRIEGFTITNGNSQFGGGIDCTDRSNPIIINNVITGNSASNGAGISCHNSSPTIIHNFINNNRGGYGPGIYCYYSSPTIANNIVSRNRADVGGAGGIYCFFLSKPKIINNLIIGNSSRYVGGIWLHISSNATVLNNIIAENNSDSSSYPGGIFVTASSPSINHNNYWHNSPRDFSWSSRVPAPEEIFEDPLFVNPAAGDYHLQSGSPCIDRGNNDAPGLPDFDFDGNPRIVDGDGDGIEVVDMGAYERQLNQPPVAVCKDIEIPADENCQGNIIPDDVNGGSYDPDEDEITLSVDNLGPFALGENYVNLTVTDEHSASETCQATVTVVDTSPPVPEVSSLPNLTGECSVTITSAPTATDNCAGIIEGDASEPLPLEFTEQGTYTIEWTYDDGNENITTQKQTIIVEDVSLPSIDSLSADPNVLWSPNHKMIPVTLTVSATDNCDLDPNCEIIDVSSNEPVNGLGDGDTAPDWEITGDLTLNLRAERSGKGSGRLYTITVRSKDYALNASEMQVTVSVPHGKGKKK